MSDDPSFEYISEMLVPVIDLHQGTPTAPQPPAPGGGVDPGWLLWLLLRRKNKKKRKTLTASPDLLGLLRVLRILSSLGALSRLNMPASVEMEEIV